eukprot:6190842-Pleurochrysis_carterae.AAC.4
MDHVVILARGHVLSSTTSPCTCLRTLARAHASSRVSLRVVMLLRPRSFLRPHSLAARSARLRAHSTNFSGGCLRVAKGARACCRLQENVVCNVLAMEKEAARRRAERANEPVPDNFMVRSHSGY